MSISHGAAERAGLPFQRDAMLARLEADEFDVVVVGGGITGAGVALDAATRGLRVALVERGDFASGTSSKSSKLVHGGLRYLQQGEVGLVYQALHERQRLRRNAPHLVKVLPFMIPVLTRDGVVSRKIARALGSAMWMYDLTGGWRIGRIHRRLRKQAALAHMPTMPSDRLASAYLYYDATVDDARLVLTVARTAADHGAVVANRCAAVDLAKDERGRVAAVVVEADGRRITVRTSAVVNAAGVWSDAVRTLDEGVDPDSIRPAKGVHLTVPWEKVRNDIAVVIPVPGDKRSLFVVPWGPRHDGTFEHTYVGTTDTDYDGPVDDPQCTADDIDYVLRALNASVTTGVTADDITGVWAGLRPLVKAASSGRTADLSRRHRVTPSPAGVITVTGGKLTTFREMAEDTVDAVLTLLGRSARCRTRRLPLRGAEGFVEHVDQHGSLPHLAHRYGTGADEVRALIARTPSLADQLVDGLPFVAAEAVYAVTDEMATTLDDVLTRRIPARLFERGEAERAAQRTAELVAPLLGRDAATTERQVADFLERCAAEQRAAARVGSVVER
ncbi:MAG: glycerol-3-phosphate dehydrogenase/oxidase [Ilumatobacteraceae bacterium]